MPSTVQIVKEQFLKSEEIKIKVVVEDTERKTETQHMEEEFFENKNNK